MAMNFSKSKFRYFSLKFFGIRTILVNEKPLKSHVGVVTFSHGGNGDPLTVVNDLSFYENLFDNHSIFQPCPGEWQEWGHWSNCDRSCSDGVRVRERACSSGTAALCDGSERDMEVCNQDVCYDWTTKGWTDWASWGECSKSCSGGVRERRRVCKDIDNNCDDTGLDYEMENCNDSSCPINACARELRVVFRLKLDLILIRNQSENYIEEYHFLHPFIPKTFSYLKDFIIGQRIIRLPRPVIFFIKGNFIRVITLDSV